MRVRLRCYCFGLAFFCLFTRIESSLFGAEGVREFPYQMRALVYDPFTSRLYATTPDGLAQIDPVTGGMLRIFPLGTNLSRLELGAGQGLWMGVNGAGAVRRFNLQTLSAEEPIVLKTNMVVNDVSASRVDPYTLAVALTTASSAGPEAYRIRNGTVLPNAAPIRHLALAANSLYGQDTGNINEYEIDSFGIQGPIRAVGSGGVSSFIILDNVLYSGLGVVWPFTQGLTRITLPNYPWPGTVAINDQTKEIVFLSLSETGFQLNRYDPTLRHTGHYIVPGVQAGNPTALSVAAWSSNRLAFHTQSNLYLVDLDQVFLPGDLEVIRQEISPTNPVFGQTVTVTLTVTNHGPGPALSALITNLFPSGTLLIEEGQAASLSQAIVPAGATFQLAATVRPAAPGVLTTRAGVSAVNDQNAANNSREFSFEVGLENPRIVRLPFALRDMAFDPVTARLFYFDGAELGILSPAGPRLLRPIQIGAASQVAIDAAGGWVVAGPFQVGHFSRTFSRVNASNLTQDSVLTGSGTMVDVKVSPRDPQLIVSTYSTGTFVNRNGDGGLLDGKSGTLAFNQDGTVLYRSDAATCALDIFEAGPGGLTFQKTVPNVACGDFVVAGGFLLFNSGTAFSPATGETRSLGIAPPAFVTTADNNSAAVLHRTNGVWAVTRFGVPDLRPLATTPLPELPTGVLDAVTAGQNHMAIRTASDFYVVELPGVFSGLAAFRLSGNQIALRFNTTSNRRYRVERSSRLSSGSWSAFGSEIAGTGYSAEILINPGDPALAFFRVVELAP